MKKWHHFTGLLLTVLLLIGAMSACSQKSAADNGTSASSKSEAAGTNNFQGKADYAGAEDSAADSGETAAQGAEVTETSISNTSAVTSNEVLVNTQDKIIRNASLDVETQDFDNLINHVDQQIKSLGGYVESSNISGKYYYSNDLRHGSIVARIPKEKFDTFVNSVYDEANVVNKQETTENVTLQYVDTESHIKTLEEEQKSLLALMEKVNKLEDILTLETQLSNVRYELESYNRQLRTYDNLVSYSTVTLNIQEVERMTDTQTVKKNVWSRIKTGLGDSFYNISEGFKNCFVWVIVNLPYLFLWGLLIAAAAIIGKRIYRKNNPKRQEISKKETEEK